MVKKRIRVAVNGYSVIGKRVAGAVVAQEQRQDDLHDAEGCRLALVRPQPSGPPSRPIECVSAVAGHSRSLEVRTTRRRKKLLSAS